jgi:hypothetical protein
MALHTQDSAKGKDKKEEEVFVAQAKVTESVTVSVEDGVMPSFTEYLNMDAIMNLDDEQKAAIQSLPRDQREAMCKSITDNFKAAIQKLLLADEEVASAVGEPKTLADMFDFSDFEKTYFAKKAEEETTKH